jgi:aminopeptidase N
MIAGILLLLVQSTYANTEAVDRSPAATSQTKENHPTALSREQAALRSKSVGKVSYTLWFGLEESRDEFQGRTVINFEIRPKSKNIEKRVFLDLEEGTVRSVSINGHPVDDLATVERFDGHHIYFKTGELQTSNRVDVTYSHKYGKDGNGLHRFKDPVDGKVYLYSDFEPYHAHRAFPCFDQPDLKATYELTVEAPVEWEVISNTLPKDVNKIDGRKSWAFPPSQVFSTYVFAIHAGPYAVWKKMANGIPTRLFARKSLAKYIDADEWLKITAQGLEYYGTQFGYPYPFGKYDQIIVPDFNPGAMENVGAVTFSERFVHRAPITNDQRRNRADTILHEMAHMWFGDLVTMQWWNGLWLNESFATFSSSGAVDQATHFSGSWQSFYASVKQWAYWEDQLVTTHPIELPVADTDQAEANFDGITYGKGASVLKQLSYYIEEEDFREGLQRYFQKYAFKNTTLNDFVKMLSEASSQDLSKWQKAWLQTSGVNTVQAVWACEKDANSEVSKISKFEILQSPANAARPHRMQIALFNFARGANRETAPLLPGKVFDVTYSAPIAVVPEAVGKPCPDMVFPNYRDYDYVKVEFDPISLKQILKNISRIPDTFVRQMSWASLWEMVIDGKLRAQDYADTVLREVNFEKDTQVLAKTLRTLVSTSTNHASVLKFLTGDLRNQYQTKIDSFVKAHLHTAVAGSDQQLVWFQAYLNAASSQTSIVFARALLNGKQKLKGFAIDQERRWQLVEILARTGAPDAEALIAKELKNDTTDMGQKQAISVEASIPSLEIKNKWLSQIIRSKVILEKANDESTPTPPPAVVAAKTNLKNAQPAGEKFGETIGSPSGTSTRAVAKELEKLPLAKIREAMQNFQILGQEDITKASVQPYFDNLPKIALLGQVEEEEYSKWFARAMYPSLCDADIVKRTSDLIEKYPNLPASVMKSLKVGRQEEERCIRAREKSLTSG